MSLRRRDLFRFGGLSGGIGLLGAAGLSVGKLLGARDARPGPLPALDIDCTSAASESPAGGGPFPRIPPPPHLPPRRRIRRKTSPPPRSRTPPPPSKSQQPASATTY